jgi:3',5'-cyclic AMP phosphodiesterase CpdA
LSLLLHISDSHFGTERPRVVRALVALARQLRPDMLVFSGDITQRARRRQFEDARALCRELGIARVLALPGNHDIPLFNLWARALHPYSAYLEAFGPRLEPVLEAAGFLIIGVNTTRPLRHKHGEVSQEQIERVCEHLRAGGPQQLRVVVTHQPVEVPRPSEEHNRLRGAEPALQAWSRAGADLVLGGHIHLPYVMNLAAREAPTPRPLWCAQAGTAVSARIRYGTSNSVNLIRWVAPIPGAPRQCTFERIDYDDQACAFLNAATMYLALGSA